MDFLNLESAEMIRVAIVAVVLVAGLGLLRWALKITAKVLSIGCLGIAIILGAMVVLGMMS